MKRARNTRRARTRRAELDTIEFRIRSELRRVVFDGIAFERRERRVNSVRRVLRSLLCGAFAAWVTVTLWLLVSGVGVGDWPRAQLGAVMFAIGLYVARRL